MDAEISYWATRAAACAAEVSHWASEAPGSRRHLAAVAALRYAQTMARKSRNLTPRPAGGKMGAPRERNRYQ